MNVFVLIALLCVFLGASLGKETTRSPQPDVNNIEYADHGFYRSSFIGNDEYFDKHWNSLCGYFPLIVTKDSGLDPPFHLKFNFTFFGRSYSQVHVSPHGFLSIGKDRLANPAATQYAAPLMAPFEGPRRYYICNGEKKFTAVWLDMATPDDPNTQFLFAITLYDNDDIAFSYKEVPKPIKSIATSPVKVGLSDAFTAYFENPKSDDSTDTTYNSISFINYDIKNKTVIKLERLPTCSDHSDCRSCVSADSNLNCVWCALLQRCGAFDSNLNPWYKWVCQRYTIQKPSQCHTEHFLLSKVDNSIDWAK
ncbi:plexin domain-containing protein 1-like [Ostrinia nubilalis]|uniref:plexin domain-containing protein 1-like n=1 Tax=Ostrinia nubilalis TaxID=29057 RepID=UPI0030822525